jgi:hypothetical protein
MLFKILVRIKRVVWNRGLLIFYSDIYSRYGENEFHWLLNSDPYAVLGTTSQEKEEYMKRLIKRRQRIHNRTWPVNSGFLI